jgi:hypothetical protein
MSSPEDEYDTNSRMFRFFRRLVFLFGDFHLLFENFWELVDTFPLCVGWKKKGHKIDDNVILKEVAPKLEVGDIILHRDSGYLSNLFIGGNLIHACVEIDAMQFHCWDKNHVLQYLIKEHQLDPIHRVRTVLRNRWHQAIAS